MDDPISLVDVPGGEKVDERIYEPLMEMLNDAEDLGPIVVSGYRTPEKQQSLYDDKIKKYKKQGYSESEAIILAGQWVAEPGTSEHQLGLHQQGQTPLSIAVQSLFIPTIGKGSWLFYFISYPKIIRTMCCSCRSSF